MRKNSANNATQQFRYEYWSAFNDYAFQNPEFSRSFKQAKATTRQGVGFAVGWSNCQIIIRQIQRRAAVSVEVYTNQKHIFQSLYQKKDEIELNIGMTLDWQALPEKKGSRILVEKPVNLTDQTDWNNQFEWIMDTCLRMKRTFQKYLDAKL